MDVAYSPLIAQTLACDFFTNIKRVDVVVCVRVADNDVICGQLLDVLQ
jgi:hypothetical protein